MRMIVVRVPGRSVDVSDDVDEGSLRRRLAAIVPDGVPLAEVVDHGARGVPGRRRRRARSSRPGGRTADGALARAIEALVGRAHAVVAVPVEVGPDDARRVAALRTGGARWTREMLVPAGADVYPWRHGTPLDVRARPRAGGDGMSVATTLLARRRRGAGTPEESVAMRVVVAGAVEIAILAVVAQGGVNGSAAILPLVMAPVGYLFSYRQRHHSNITTKVLLPWVCSRRSWRSCRACKLAGSVDQARVPLASLFLWVQVLHAFDVPRRRDLSFSMVSSVILMAEAGALSLSSSFVLFVLPWAVLTGGWLFLSSRPRRPTTTEPVSVRRRSSGARRTAASVRGAAWAGSVGRARERPRVHGDPAAPRHARPVAAVLARGRRVGRVELRRRRGEPVAARRRRATAWSTSRRTPIRDSATSSTCARAGTCRTRSRSGCGRRRPRSGGRRRSTRSTGPVDDLGPIDRAAAGERRTERRRRAARVSRARSDRCRPSASPRRSTSRRSSPTCCSPRPSRSRCTSRPGGWRWTTTARSVRRSSWTRAWCIPWSRTSR